MTVLCSVHFLLVRFFSFYARFDLNARVVLLHFRWRQFIHYCDWITHYTVFKTVFKEMNTGFERCIHNEFANKSKLWTWDTRWNASQSHYIYSQIHHIKGLWKMHSFYFLNKKERKKNSIWSSSTTFWIADIQIWNLCRLSCVYACRIPLLHQKTESKV